MVRLKLNVTVNKDLKVMIVALDNAHQIATMTKKKNVAFVIKVSAIVNKDMLVMIVVYS
jgi:hypothetical protein